MLSGARSLQRERTHHHPVVQRFRTRDFRRVLRIHEDQEMEITVAHVPDDADGEFGPVDVVARGEHALCKAGDGHADIGDQRARPGSQRHR